MDVSNVGMVLRDFSSPLAPAVGFSDDLLLIREVAVAVRSYLRHAWPAGPVTGELRHLSGHLCLLGPENNARCPNLQALMTVLASA